MPSDSGAAQAVFNGFTNSRNNVPVTVGEPTLQLPYPSGVTYVEVEISQTVPTYFLRVLGYKSMKVGRPGLKL